MGGAMIAVPVVRKKWDINVPEETGTYREYTDLLSPYQQVNHDKAYLHHIKTPVDSDKDDEDEDIIKTTFIL